MDPILYEAVKNGDIEEIVRYEDEFFQQLTSNKNTVLHVMAQFRFSPSQTIDVIIETIFNGKSSDFVESMLSLQNSEGETAFHVASRNGQYDIVLSLIRVAKNLDKDRHENGPMEILLRVTNKYGDTPLHEAVRYNDTKIVEVLVKEDPMFQHLLNDMEETPLYLAVESHFHSVVESILTTCVSPSFIGPKSRTALHAAIIGKCKACTIKLIEKLPRLTKVVDAFGWTPLHYAALFDFENGATELLKADLKLANHTADMDDKKTALHVAACNGSVKVMKEILKHRPDCWEMVTGKGHNILHLAVHHKKERALRFILRNPWVMNLVNQKDCEGNTPLHLYAASKWLEGRALLRQNRANLNALNKQNCTPLDILRNEVAFMQKFIENNLLEGGAFPGARNLLVKENGGYRAQRHNATIRRNDIQVDLGKLSETHLIVAALIATVTFAAGFTIPGGYEENSGPYQGMSVLTRRAAFKTFIVTDTIALISSIIAVVLHLAASSREDSRIVRDTYALALAFIKLSVISMTITFTTGVYTAMDPSSALAITVCLIGGLALLIFSIFIAQLVINFFKPIVAIFISDIVHLITRKAPWVSRHPPPPFP